MKQLSVLVALLLLLPMTSDLLAQSQHFPTSLHAQRSGKYTWYSAENGGVEDLFNVPFDHPNLGCTGCHGPTDANGEAYTGEYQPSCSDCHPSDDFMNVSQDQCLGCHGRQGAEINLHQLADVHRDGGMVCWDCHGTEDLHGDGTEYASMLETGAIDADCENCHSDLGEEHAGYDPHGGKLHCQSCHAETVISCYNCHFESQVESHVKRAKQQVKNFILLVNREKDGKVGLASFQSLSYDGKAFVAFGPYNSHSVKAEGRTCTDCHANLGGDIPAIAEYNSTGEIKFATWNEADSTLSNLNGVIPMPEDFLTAWKMDFLTYNGATDDAVGPSKNWSAIGKSTPDKLQMLYATPLSSEQMAKIGMGTTDGDINENFETSLHKLRPGKYTWYNAENGGAEEFFNVPFDHPNLGCTECHGPTDADGNPVSANYEPSCSDCHSSTMAVEESQCYGCHGRQKAEVFVHNLPDVHRDGGMKCWDCHTSGDLHGDGTEYASMLEPGAIDADCSNEGCHPALSAEHASYDPHGGKLHCQSCHAKTVISCYNCHFESQVESHVKRAKQQVKDFIMLVNRDKDGKVGLASFQSLSYDGKAFVAFGPYNAHSVVKEGRTCADCHANMGGEIPAITEYNQSGTVTFATWDDTEKKLTNMTGVIPIPADYETSWQMDFLTYDGATNDPVGPSTNWSPIGKPKPDMVQMLYATPLSEEQMGKLGMGTDAEDISGNFETSLHKLRPGKYTWYNAENGGAEEFFNVPFDHPNLGCTECHGPTDADGNEYTGEYEPSCADCHSSSFAVEESQCYGCHGRQSAEVFVHNLPDVHRDGGMKCWDCHTSGDLHGDGTEYASMLEPGAIDADCENCHSELPASHADYDPHGGKLHCQSCHAASVISCYNCHFESQVDSHKKRAKQQVKNFIMLVNREKDGKVGLASFQSLSYQGKAFVAFGPYNAHSVIKEGRTCADCHANFGGNIPAITEYNQTGKITFATWSNEDSTLTNITGVVPIPEDYADSWYMDFLTYNGSTDDPVGPSKNWSTIGKPKPDKVQMLYATPLSSGQMAKIGMVKGTDNDIAENFETSLHKLRPGKYTWYKAENGGVEDFFNVPFDHPNLGCTECHGPTDADGNAYTGEYEPSCADCHSSTMEVNESQCLGCHGRQSAEINVHKLPDVHRDGGMKCWDCHTSGDLHGDGTEYASMLEPGAIDADCENCHTELSEEHAEYDPHGGKLHCQSCHAETVISCYNCHFESQVESHVKRAKQQVRNFIMLVNRDKDGKVGLASFQSLSYEGKAFVAFGPYNSHSVKAEGRGCLDCHANMGGEIPAITEYNETGRVTFATWNEADSTLTNITGVIPIPFDYAESWYMDFLTYNGATEDPVGPSKNWSTFGKPKPDMVQMLYATPLSAEQMAKLGMLEPTGITDNAGKVPTEYQLAQNYPNPFNPSTTIQYALPAAGHVNITVYNILGKEVAELVNGNKEAGVHSVHFNAASLPSGVYFYQLTSGSFSDVKKLLLMK